MIVPFLALALAAGPVEASWYRAGVTDDGVVHYINVDSLKVSGPGKVTIWSRIELAKPTFGKETRSMRILLEHDCLLHKQRYLQVFSYTEPNLSGYSEFTLGKGNWYDIQLDSVGGFIHNSVCKYR